MRRRVTGLWRRPDFIRLWTAYTISRIGSQLGALGLAAILLLGATPGQMGLLAALAAAPVLLVGLPAGVWVDRLHRRPLLIAADLGRAALLGSVPLAAALGRLRIEQLYLVALLTGVFTVIFEVADQAYLPSLVAREHLLEANSAIEASSAVAEIGGPPLGGLLVQTVGASIAVLLDALSFLVSAVCLRGIRAAEPPPVPPMERQAMLHEIVEGLRVVLGHPILRALVLTSASFELCGNFIGTLYSLFVIRTLGLPPLILGLSVGIGGLSAFAGAVVAARVNRRFSLGRTLIASLALYGCVQLLLPLAGGPTIVAASLLFAAQGLGDIFISVFFVAERSLRQAMIPDRLLGRANASMQVISGSSGPLGALCAGVLGSAIGIRQTLLLGVIGVILSSLWLFFSPIRGLQQASA